MGQPTYTLDLRQFDARFKQYVAAVPEDAKVGVRLALDELKLDADNEPPRTPHLEGHLRASGRVVNVQSIMDEISGEIHYGGQGVSEEGVSYSVPYAARWHEAEPGTVEWSEPGVGPKFVTTKLSRHNKKYTQIIAAHIKKVRG